MEKKLTLLAQKEQSVNCFVRTFELYCIQESLYTVTHVLSEPPPSRAEPGRSVPTNTEPRAQDACLVTNTRTKRAIVK